MPAHPVDRSILKGKSIKEFREAVKSDYTLDAYERRLISFLKFVKMTPDQLVLYARKNPQQMEKKISSFISIHKDRVKNREITASTIRNFLKPIHLLFIMNDATQINWKKIKMKLPPSRRVALDRNPTIDEIREIIDACDIRGKALTYLYLTSGVREGAIEYFKRRDYSVIKDKDGRVLAGRLVVYRGEENEEYVTFCSAEAVSYLDKYLQFRESNGENITPTSPLFRDKFDPVKKHYGYGKVDKVIPMTSHSVRMYYNRLFRSIGFRKERRRRHEFSVHSMRKWYKTRCELGGMKPITVETLSGRSTGVSDHYFRPTESELLQEFLKVSDEHLSISTESKLRSENESLKVQGQELKSLQREFEEVRKRLGL